MESRQPRRVSKQGASTVPSRDDDGAHVRGCSSAASSASPAAAPRASSPPSHSESVLYAVLLHHCLSHRMDDKESADLNDDSRAPLLADTLWPTFDVEGPAAEAIRDKVATLFPYQGCLVEWKKGEEEPPGTLASGSCGTEGILGAALGRRNEEKSSRCWCACIGTWKPPFFRTGSDDGGARPLELLRGATSTEVMQPSPTRKSTPLKAAAPSAESPRVIIMKRPPKGVIATLKPSSVSAASDSGQQVSSPTSHATLCSIDSASSNLFPARASESSSSVHSQHSRRPTIVAADHMADVRRHLSRLLDDFAAAMEHCSDATERQRNVYEATLGALRGEVNASFADVVTSPTGTTTGAHPNFNSAANQNRRGSLTFFTHGVPPNCVNRVGVSGQHPSNRSRGKWIREEGVAPCRGVSGAETPGKLEGVAELPPTEETADLTRGMATVAFIIAEHIRSILHPKVVPNSIEDGGDAAQKQLHYRVEGCGAGARSSSPAGTRTTGRSCGGAMHDDWRFTHVVPLKLPSPLQATRNSRGIVVMPERYIASEETQEFRRFLHSCLWSRIVALLDRISLCDASNEGAPQKAESNQERRDIRAFAQLAFWIWLYTACGLATDAIQSYWDERQGPVARTTAVAGADSLSGSVCNNPRTMPSSSPLALPQLLPTVETLARHWQRHQYHRLCPTSETALTLNMFLSLTGVPMTENSVAERMFPRHSTASDGNAPFFSMLQPRTTPDFTVASESTSEPCHGFTSTRGMAKDGTLERVDLRFHTEELPRAHEPAIRAGSMGGRDKCATAGNDRENAGRGIQRDLHSQSLPVGEANDNGDSMRMRSSAETQSPTVEQHFCPSTAEIYLNWLQEVEGKTKPTRLGLRMSTTVSNTAHADGALSTLGHSGHQEVAAQGHVYDWPVAEPSKADHSDCSAAEEQIHSRMKGGCGGGAVAGGLLCLPDPSSREKGVLLQLSSVLTSADSTPSLPRVEKELQQARAAVQLARKLGTLYATQDMNTLLPLLPAVNESESLLSDACSGHMKAGAIGSSEVGSDVLRAHTNSHVGRDSHRVPVDRFQSSLTEAPINNLPKATGLPSLLLASPQAKDRLCSGVPLLSSRCGATNAVCPAPCLSIESQNARFKSLMERFNSLLAVAVAQKDALFSSETLALELALSLSVVLLSHITEEVRPRSPFSEMGADGGTYACHGDPFHQAGRSSGACVTPAASRPVKQSAESSTAVASHAVSRKRDGMRVTEPSIKCVPWDPARLLGFDTGRTLWRRLSATVRETLSGVALRTLQKRNVSFLQVLLHYLVLDTTLAHHEAWCRHHDSDQRPLSTALHVRRAKPEEKCKGVKSKRRKESVQSMAHPPVHWAMSSLDGSASFVNVWYSSFAALTETTRHQLKGHENIPTTLKDAVWHLAGLAQYFAQMRDCGYLWYRGQCCCSSPVTFAEGHSPLSSTATSLVDGDCSADKGPLVAGRNHGLQGFLSSQLMEPGEMVLEVMISFMEKVAETLTAEMKSGAAAKRQHRQGVLLAGDSSSDDDESTCLTADESGGVDKAAQPASFFDADSGENLNDADMAHAQTCWMELAIHYFLEIVDVLLDAALLLPEKPLFLYQLTVSASHAAATSSDYVDGLATVGLACTGVSPLWGAGDSPTSFLGAPSKAAADSPLDRVQEFLSFYTAHIVQAAVTRFTADDRFETMKAATMQVKPGKVTATTVSASNADRSSRSFLARLLASASAPRTAPIPGETPSTCGRFCVGRQTTTPGLMDLSAEAGACDLHSLPDRQSTLWWPGMPFRRHAHLIRVVEHAQLVSVFLNIPTTQHAPVSAPILPFLEMYRAAHEGAASLQVSAVTALLNTSTGPCAQLLSIPYSCLCFFPDVGHRTPCYERALEHERSISGFAMSPLEQRPGRSPLVPRQHLIADRVSREACSALWIRIEILRLLRHAATPLDAESFASFTVSAAEIATQVREKSTQAHFTAIASMRANGESVMPSTYASTYVRLLFLRYVQAFYADIQALKTKRTTVVPGAAAPFNPLTSEPFNGVEGKTPFTGGGAASQTGSMAFIDTPFFRTLGSPRVADPVSPFQHLTQRLWMQYCLELLRALRELCWSCAEAHTTASKLSIASVFGHLLQMIGGHCGAEEEEEEEDDEYEVHGDRSGEGQHSEASLLEGALGLSSGVAFGGTLASFSASKVSEREDFIDFEVSSSGSSVTMEPPADSSRQSCPGEPSDAAFGEDERSMTPSKASHSPPSKRRATAKPTDLRPTRELESQSSKGSRTRFMNGDTEATRENRTPRGASSTSMTATPPSPPLVRSPAVPALSFAGLTPALYFASCGDTAAAQENDFFKEQRSTEGKAARPDEASRPQDESRMSLEDEGDGEIEACDVSSASLRGPLSLFDMKQGFREMKPQGADAIRASGGVEAGKVVPPQTISIPKLALGTLGPPLYFASSGDTGVFAEGTVVPSPLQSPALARPTLSRHAPPTSSVAKPVHVDPNCTETRKAAVKPFSAAAITSPSPSFGALLAAPATALTTVGGLILPKLALGALGPPMYFTSTGDTGGFVEAQKQKLQSTADTSRVLLSSDNKESQLNASASPNLTPATRVAATAEAVTCMEAAEVSPARRSSVLSDITDSNSASSCHSGTASLPPKDAVHDEFSQLRKSIKDEEDGRRDSTADQRNGGHRRCSRHSEADPSLNSFGLPEADLPPLLGNAPSGRRERHESHLSLGPIVLPTVTMELILSLCSVILQRDSGLIQYRYTVSSLTQKRVLPGISPTSQRRRHTRCAGMGSPEMMALMSPKSMPSISLGEATKAERHRHTPQHSPSSFHVIQAMHNFLKDGRNSHVADLLEQWLLCEHAADERARMEEYEAAYAPSSELGSSQIGHSRSLPSLFGDGNASKAAHRGGAFRTAGSRSDRSPNNAMITGRYVLLRLLLPRVITPFVVQLNDRRIGAGGYGTVTSGMVQRLATGMEAQQLPTEWGRRGSLWCPGKANGCGAAGSGGGTATPSSAGASRFLTTTEKATATVLRDLRTPWRAAVQRIANVLCHGEVAIKHISLNAQGNESGNLPLCHSEVLAMYRLRMHPHIVPLISFDNTKDEYMLVMPFYNKGSLRVWRQKHYPLGCTVLTLPPRMQTSHEDASALSDASLGDLHHSAPVPAPTSSLFATCARCLVQVLEAVDYMHEQHIRHGDIKCDNVLIASAEEAIAGRGPMDPPSLPSSVRLCDFGSCDTCDDDDISNLKNEVMAGEARFLAGRWGVGRGTEAIQPPELMSAKRRYTVFRRIMAAAYASPQTSSYVTFSERLDRVPSTTRLSATAAEYFPFRGRVEETSEAAERYATNQLRRAELSVDIWACGCLLYEMLTGRMLFGEARLGRLLVLAAVDETDNNDAVPKEKASRATAAAAVAQEMLASGMNETASGGASAKASRDSGKALDDWERRDLEAAVGKRVVDFMCRMLDLDPLKRPNAQEALYHWRDIMMSLGLPV